MTTPEQEPVAEPDWEDLQTEVWLKMKILRSEWDRANTYLGPVAREAMRRERLLPALRCLAKFCLIVSEEDPGEED